MTIHEETRVLHTLRDLPLVDNIIAAMTTKKAEVTDNEEIFQISHDSTPR
jgi:hypothetical protein